jgi:hypothetical protein
MEVRQVIREDLGQRNRLKFGRLAGTEEELPLDSIVHPQQASQTVKCDPGEKPVRTFLPAKYMIKQRTKGESMESFTWPTITPLSPTIIRRQITSHFNTKDQVSLKRCKKSAKGRTVCCSERRLTTVDARALDNSAAEESMSKSSSCKTGISTVWIGDLTREIISEPVRIITNCDEL